jgi:hypothetical protein
MIRWIFFPRSSECPELGRHVIKAFEDASSAIDSAGHELSSNEVLLLVAPALRDLGFVVEAGKAHVDKIRVPVLFGEGGSFDKSFDADAYHRQLEFVVEVEAGRGVTNNQFLKDLFQACMMHGVTHLAIALRNLYRGGNDFERVVRFFETLYASNRLRLPLAGVLIIGY